jgi:long-chain fatty acid transport protein
MRCDVSKRNVSLLLSSALLLLAAPARADLANQFGISPKSMGLAGAYTGVSDDLAALYYNPAGLVQLKGMTVAAGVLFAFPFLSEDSTRLGMPNEESYYLHAGISFTGKLKDHLALGVSLNLPMGKHLSATLYKKQDPDFVLYDYSVQILQIRVGGAFRIPWKPLEFLTIGAAIQILGSLLGEIGFYSPFQRSDAQGNAADPDSRLEAWGHFEMPTTVFATVGMMAFLGDHWRVGVTYRQQQYIEVQLPIVFTTRLALSDTSRVNLPVAGTAIFKPKFFPHQVSLGASYQRKKLLLTGDLTWINYSNFATPFPEVKLDIDELKKDPGTSLLLGNNSVLLDPMQPHLEWQDVVVPRIGVEYQFLSWLTGRAGYFYERSPLKAADVPIYDCDKHGLTLSARASFLRPLNLIPGWLNIDVALEELIYAPRKIIGSDVGGHAFALSSGVELIFL